MAQIGFPLDSKIVGYDGSGLPVYSNQYFSEDFRNVLRNFFSNGVVSSGEELRPVAYSLGSNTVEANVRPGSAIINGAMFTSDSVEVFSLPVPAAPSTGEAVKHYHIVIGLDTSKTNGDEQMTMYVKPAIANQTPQEDLTRTAVKYEICIMTVTITVASNEPYVTFVDRRLDPDWCGIAAPFAELDTSQIYEALNAEIQKLNKQTEIAVELARDALNDTVAGSLENKITELEENSALLDGGVELAKNRDLNFLFTPGSYFVDAQNVDSIQHKPDGVPTEHARVYVMYMGVSQIPYQDEYFNRYLQVWMPSSGEYYTRIAVGKSNTSIQSQNTPWQKVVFHNSNADITADMLSDDLRNSLFGNGFIDRSGTIESKQSGNIQATIKNMKEFSIGNIHIMMCVVEPNSAVVAPKNSAFDIASFNPNCKAAFLVADTLVGASSSSNTLWANYLVNKNANQAISCIIVYIT